MHALFGKFMISVRQYRDDDYALICSWSTNYNIKPYPKSALSPYSYIAEYKGKPIMYSSIYLGDRTTLALYGNTISDKNVKNTIKYKALELLMDTCLDTARFFKYNYVTYFSDNNGIKKMLIKRGAEINNTFNITLSLDGSNTSFMD